MHVALRGGSELGCAGGWWACAGAFLLACCLGSPAAMSLRKRGCGGGPQLRCASFVRWCPRHVAARAFLAWAGGVAFWAPCPRPCFALGRGTPPRSRVLGSPAVTSLRKWGNGGGPRAEVRVAWRCPRQAAARAFFGLGVRLCVLGFVSATRLLAGSGGTATLRPRHADSPFRRVVRAGSAGEGLGPPHTCSTGAPPSALVGQHGPPEYLLVLWRARGGKRVALPASLRGGRGAMGSRLHAARPGKPLRVVVC